MRQVHENDRKMYCRNGRGQARLMSNTCIKQFSYISRYISYLNVLLTGKASHNETVFCQGLQQWLLKGLVKETCSVSTGIVKVHLCIFNAYLAKFTWSVFNAIFCSVSEDVAIILKKNWAATWQNQQCGCAPSEDSAQPGHPPSLIRVFAGRMKKA